MPGRCCRTQSVATTKLPPIALAYNPENHDKVKHVERRHFFIREKVEDGLLSVPYVRTVDNIADIFTKSLPKETFFSMRDQIIYEL